MFYRILEKLNRALSRRSALGKITSSCTAVALAILGLAQPASAFTVFCCTLCSSTLCTNMNPPPVCAGTWCWLCAWKNHPIGTCRLIECFECYNSNAPSTCFNNCNNTGAFCGHCADTICSDACDTGLPCS